MRVALFLLTFCAFAHGACVFDQNDLKSKNIEDKIKNWSIYNKNYTIQAATSIYQIGICVALDSSNSSTAISQKENNTVYSLGELNNARLVDGDNLILLTYEHGTLYNNQCYNQSRSSSIIFVCGKSSNAITVLQEHTIKDPRCKYTFQFQVPELCADVPQEKQKLSGIGIFFIIILCLASAYLIGGFLFMRLVRGTRGIEQIPNLEMWQKLGNLAADGCDFCCRCRCDRNIPRAGYFIDETGPDLNGDDDILSP